MVFPSVSLVIVNYNGKGYVEECVQSFRKTNYPDFEIIFVDNNSNDGSYEIIRKIKGSIQIIRNKSNLGFAGGCNKGLDFARGKYIVLINNDDKATNPNWLRELIKIAESDPQIGACFGKKLQWDHPDKIDSVGNTIDRVGFTEQIGKGEKDESQYNHVAERLVWQTPVLIRREIIEKVGGLFDPKYFILHDDTDLSWRIWLAKYKIIFVPKSVICHKRSATIKKLPPHIPAFHGKKNILMTLLKNYELKNLIKNLPIHLFISLLSVFYYLIKKRYDLALSSPKAILWNLKNLRSVLIKRVFIQKYVRKIPDREIMKHLDRFNIWSIIKREKIWPK